LAEEGIFKNVTPEETHMSHVLFTAAIESHKTGKIVNISGK